MSRVGLVVMLLAARGAAAATPGAHMAAESLAYAQKLSEKGWTRLAGLVYEDVLAHAPPQVQTAQVRFELAHSLFKNRQFHESATHFEALVESHPGPSRLAEALYWAGESHYAAGRCDKALAAFQRCMDTCTDTRDEKYVHSHYGSGWCHYKLGHYEQAAAHFKTFAERYFYYKLASDAQLALGRSLAKLKQYDDACRALNVVVAHPGSDEQQAEAYLAIGRVRFDEQRYVEAMAAFDSLLSKHPESDLVPPALWWKARSFQEWGQLDRASQVFGELARLYPQSLYGREAVVRLGERLSQLPTGQADPDMLPEDHLFALAEAAYRAHDFDRGVKLYEQTLERFPKGTRTAHAQFQLGLCHMRGKRYEAALERFLAVLKDHSGSELRGQATRHAARCAFHLGRYAQAQKLLEGLLAGQPTDDVAGRARFLLAECQVQNGDYASAAENYEQALALSLDESLLEEANWRMGTSRYHAQQFLQAGAVLGEFRGNFPSSARVGEALYLEADSRLRCGKQDKAGALLAQYVELQPPGEHLAQAHYQLGWIAERTGRLNEALTQYRRAARKAEAPDGQAHERVCWVLWALDDKPAALDAFAELIRRWPKRKLSPQTYNWVSLHLLEAKRYADAVVAFEQLLAHSGRDPAKVALVEQAHHCLAQCYLALGEQDARLVHLRTLVGQFPESRFATPAKLALADHEAGQGRGAQAAALYRAVARVSSGPVQAEALVKLGETMVEGRDRARAENILNRVAVVYDSPQTRYWALRARLAAGACAHAASRDQAAERHYRAVADAAEGSPAIEELRREAMARLLERDTAAKPSPSEEPER